jgi:hypothetical protein
MHKKHTAIIHELDVTMYIYSTIKKISTYAGCGISDTR